MIGNLFTHDGATFSTDRKYRYALWRHWGALYFKVDLVWICLNPSTATDFVDDPTIRKLRGFATRWGYDGFTIANLFAWRSTEPAGLKDAFDPVGPENDSTIREIVAGAKRVVMAWGSHAPVRRLLEPRVQAVTSILAEYPHIELGYLTLCKDGNPGHPLMLPYSTTFKPSPLRQLAASLSR